jgi:hypothetical protein
MQDYMKYKLVTGMNSVLSLLTKKNFNEENSCLEVFSEREKKCN